MKSKIILAACAAIGTLTTHAFADGHSSSGYNWDGVYFGIGGGSGGPTFPFDIFGSILGSPGPKKRGVDGFAICFSFSFFFFDALRILAAEPECSMPRYIQAKSSSASYKGQIIWKRYLFEKKTVWATNTRKNIFCAAKFRLPIW